MNDKMIAYIESLPNLCDSLPYIFSETGEIIEDLTVQCAHCKKEIHACDIKGTFESLNKHSVSLIAYGLCYDDKTATPLEARFASDGDLLTKGPNGWVKTRWGKDNPESWFAKLKALIFPGV